jgi:predicted ATP-dependent serine protease
LYEIDAATLKINVPMDQSRFAIPDSVEYIHADLDTHQSLPSAAASGEDAMIARLLVGHVYDGSMAGWNYFQRVADAIVREQWNDAVVGRAGRYLQARFGAVQKLELLSSDLGATTVDTVWRVAASQGVFSMQTEFDVSGKLTGVWFQLDPDGQWTALADLGSEAP